MQPTTKKKGETMSEKLDVYSRVTASGLTPKVAAGPSLVLTLTDLVRPGLLQIYRILESGGRSAMTGQLRMMK
jgi:hypothetical protein